MPTSLHPLPLTSFRASPTLSRHNRVWAPLMPPKVRELIAELERAGFVNHGGRGSHRNFVHPRLAKPITISGGSGDDAKQYQILAVRRAIEDSKE